MTKKTMVALVAVLLFSQAQANEAAQKCEELKGSYEWNGNINKWQCLDENKTIIEIGFNTATAEDVATGHKEESSLGKKALMVIAAPVVIVGGIVYAIVMSPVWLVKKLTGSN